MGLRPVFFGPCTPHGKPGQVRRTWGTRPGNRASFLLLPCGKRTSAAEAVKRRPFTARLKPCPSSRVFPHLERGTSWAKAITSASNLRHG
jgi:hypothetical protein